MSLKIAENWCNVAIYIKMTDTRMRKFLILFLSVVFVGGIIVLGFVRKPEKIDENKLQVSASFYPLYFFASQIGGEKINVVNVTPAGAEPHDYEPTPSDIAKIENSKLLILNGVVEPWGEKIKKDLAEKNIPVIRLSEGLVTKDLDPHVWLAPQLAKKEAQKILAALGQIDPNNKTYYQSNEKELENKLDKLDNDFKLGLKNCTQQDIITSHAAFSYLASSYGLRQVPITGLSPDSDPSAKQIAQVTEFAKNNNIKYIFFESLISPKLSDTIASEIGAKTLVLDPLEGIADDKLQMEENYFTVMENNLANLRIALECKN